MMNDNDRLKLEERLVRLERVAQLTSEALNTLVAQQNRVVEILRVITSPIDVKETRQW
jgi:hypothetical protein